MFYREMTDAAVQTRAAARFVASVSDLRLPEDKIIAICLVFPALTHEQQVSAAHVFIDAARDVPWHATVRTSNGNELEYVDTMRMMLVQASSTPGV